MPRRPPSPPPERVRASARALALGALLAASAAAPGLAGAAGEERRVSEPSLRRLALPGALERVAGNASRTPGADRWTRELDRSRAAVPLDSLSATSGDAWAGDRASEELSDAVRRAVERAARRTVKGYLLDVTDIERRVDGWRESLRDGGAGDGAEGGQAPGPARRNPVRVQVGFHSYMPQVGLRYDLGHGGLKLTVGGRGNASLRYRARGAGGTEIRVGFDGEDTYSLALRVGF